MENWTSVALLYKISENLLSKNHGASNGAEKSKTTIDVKLFALGAWSGITRKCTVLSMM